MNVSLSVTYRNIDTKELKKEYKKLLSDRDIKILNLSNLSFIKDKHHKKVYNDYKSWVSNTSKGNTTDFDQLINVFSQKRSTKEIKLRNFSNSLCEEFELVNLKKIYDEINHYSFKLKDFKKVNNILGTNIKEGNFNKKRGKFKHKPTKEIFMKPNEEVTYNISFCPPHNVKKELKKLLSFINSKSKDKNSFKEIFVLATIFIVEFNKIHPFEIGNGRVSKVFFEKIFERNDIFPLILFDEKGKEKFKEILYKTDLLTDAAKMRHSYKNVVIDFYNLYEPKIDKAKNTFDELLKRIN